MIRKDYIDALSFNYDRLNDYFLFEQNNGICKVGGFMNNTKVVTNDEFISFIEQELQEIISLFRQKNKAYGNGGNDVFYNFRQTAIRLFGNDSIGNMFLVAEVLKDKHNVALAKGDYVPECKERLRDNIVYSLIQLGMLEQESERNS